MAGRHAFWLNVQFGEWRARASERLARSTEVFLLGLLIACGIEVLVDWNQTLYEINVLRDGMRQRGQNYVGILQRAAVEPMLGYDTDGLDRLSAGLFDDEDVIFVRFVDPLGTTLYDRLRPAYAVKFGEHHKQPFRDHYKSQMERDVRGILSDPEDLRMRIAKSRHRDFVQAWNDLLASLKARFVPPGAGSQQRSTVVLYQDRLRNEKHERDPDVTYALGTIVDDHDETWGALLVAFSMERVNAAIWKKYLKGAGMAAFFLGLILIQNATARRRKLRLLDVQQRYGAARRTLREALPPRPAESCGLRVYAAVSQAEECVDGMVWDVRESADGLHVVVIDPDGEGIDAAATALQVLRDHRRHQQEGPGGSFEQELSALGAAALQVPLSRPIGVLLLRLSQDGTIEAVMGPLGGLRVLGKNAEGGAAALEESPGPADVLPGIVGPLTCLRGTLPEGGILCAVLAGMAPRSRNLDPAEVAGHLARPKRPTEIAALAEDAARWARGRLRGLGSSDVMVVVATR